MSSALATKKPPLMYNFAHYYTHILTLPDCTACQCWRATCSMHSHSLAYNLHTTQRGGCHNRRCCCSVCTSTCSYVSTLTSFDGPSATSWVHGLCVTTRGRCCWGSATNASPWRCRQLATPCVIPFAAAAAVVHTLQLQLWLLTLAHVVVTVMLLLWVL